MTGLFQNRNERMKSKINWRLLVMGVLAFLGVTILVAAILLTCTTIFTRVETSSGFPVLYVSEAGGSTCRMHPLST